MSEYPKESSFPFFNSSTELNSHLAFERGSMFAISLNHYQFAIHRVIFAQAWGLSNISWRSLVQVLKVFRLSKDLSCRTTFAPDYADVLAYRFKISLLLKSAMECQ